MRYCHVKKKSRNRGICSSNPAEGLKLQPCTQSAVHRWNHKYNRVKGLLGVTPSGAVHDYALRPYHEVMGSYQVPGHHACHLG